MNLPCHWSAAEPLLRRAAVVGLLIASSSLSLRAEPARFDDLAPGSAPDPAVVEARQSVLMETAEWLSARQKQSAHAALVAEPLRDGSGRWGERAAGGPPRQLVAAPGGAGTHPNDLDTVQWLLQQQRPTAVAASAAGHGGEATNERPPEDAASAAFWDLAFAAGAIVFGLAMLGRTVWRRAGRRRRPASPSAVPPELKQWMQVAHDSKRRHRSRRHHGHHRSGSASTREAPSRAAPR